MPQPTTARSHPASPHGGGLHPSTPTLLALFLACFQTTGKDVASRHRREEIFRRFAAGGRGYLSLAEVCAGVQSSLVGTHGRAGVPVYHRYYRCFLRAYQRAKDAAPPRPRRPEDDDYVTRAEFRRLLHGLCTYAKLYEVFAYLLDVGHGPDGDGERDHRLSRAEWEGGVEKVRQAGRSWAPFIRLREARASDFDRMDQNGSSLIDFREFSEWVEATEKLAATDVGLDLCTNAVISKSVARHSGHERASTPGRSDGLISAGLSAGEHLAQLMSEWGYPMGGTGSLTSSCEQWR